MPWFGLDIGGTLVKLVYFEPTDQEWFPEYLMHNEKDKVALIHRYMVMNKAYGNHGFRDDHLQLDDVHINDRKGTIHFIRFPSCSMPNFISLSRSKGFANVSSTVCATGGGAHKYADAAQEFDELESLIHGIEFIAKYNPDECYYWKSPLDDTRCEKVTWRWFNNSRNNCPQMSVGVEYPYLVVNIGSGVSVVAVDSPNDFQRVSGSSIGGGFFHGLCCLLCGCDTFEEAIEIAAKGDNTNVDKLVRDIYGGDYQLGGLPGDTVAASFGHMISAECRASASKEDLARAALVTVTNNIGSIAMNCAMNRDMNRILFVGNFLRVNPIAARSLSYAMDYWSNGSKKALFLQHEGYFGSVGCLEKLMVVTEERRKERVANGHLIH